MKVSSKKSRRKLAAAWFIGSFLLLLILIFQTAFGKYGDNITEAWGWFLPIVMPTLSLMIAVFAYNASLGKPSDKKIDSFFII